MDISREGNGLVGNRLPRKITKKSLKARFDVGVSESNLNDRDYLFEPIFTACSTDIRQRISAETRTRALKIPKLCRFLQPTRQSQLSTSRQIQATVKKTTTFLQGPVSTTKQQRRSSWILLLSARADTRIAARYQPFQ